MSVPEVMSRVMLPSEVRQFAMWLDICIGEGKVTCNTFPVSSSVLSKMMKEFSDSEAAVPFCMSFENEVDHAHYVMKWCSAV